MSEIKQTNFRINSETADRFRAFCEENGMNQAQGFDHLIQILELDQAKAIVPERALEIEEFERYTKAILSAFLNSVELAKNTEERVLEQFRSKLESKDAIIMELQAKVDELMEDARSLESKTLESESAKKQAEEIARKAVADTEKAEKTAQDKAQIADMLSAELAKAKLELEDYPSLKKQNTDLMQAISKAELEKEKALIALERSKNKEVQVLRDKIDELKDQLAEMYKKEK